jgi:hypothetical protein
VIINNFRAVSSGALRGFCDVTMPSGMILYGCGVFVKGDTTWCSPPSQKKRAANGSPVVGRDGKAIYESQIGFATKDARTRWTDAVVAALRVQCPHALA